ncbi:MAG TPA: hypoxanthine phosphoribosyltransferase, partial [Ktedonobacterales bacterium]|nr:hypoxanthine phosphoribosyltransferase [Ktedonobacterales bacterium]
MAISPNLHDDIEEILIPQHTLQARIAELASAISHDFAGKDLVLVGILKGAVMFMVDLARSLNVPLDMDFMAISSYGNSTESSGVVRILKDLDQPIAGKHVLIVEDIIDTGLTLRYLVEILGSRGPASLTICTLLDKEK